MIKCKLEPRVSEEVYNAAVGSLAPSPTDTCSLYLNLATVAALPVKCSRHNTPSRAHAITRLVLNSSVGVDENIVVSSKHHIQMVLKNIQIRFVNNNEVSVCWILDFYWTK